MDFSKGSHLTHARPFLLAAALVGAALAAEPIGAAPIPSVSPAAVDLTGLVKNGLGSGLERTVVLLTLLGASDEVRTTVTDKEGLFRFDGVPAGEYRITAIKEGYESAIGKVSAWTRQKLDMVLIPAGQERKQPKGSDWILKAPKRDILRELHADAGLAGTDGLPPADPPGRRYASRADHPAQTQDLVSELLADLEGEISQSFTDIHSGSVSSSDSAEMTGGSGSKTALLLGSPIGPRLRMNLMGERERDSTSWRAAEFDGRSASANRLSVSMGYETGGSGHLDMRAYYDHDALLIEPAARNPIALPGPGRERRAWGYDAGWVGGLGKDASLQLDLRYLENAVDFPASTRSARSLSKSEALADKAGAQTNVWKTAALLSKKVGSSHQVQVALDARFFSFGPGQARVAPSASQDPSLFGEMGEDGWIVSVGADESWSIIAPIAVDFGFDLTRSASPGTNREVVVPRAGITYTPGPSTTLRGAVSYVVLNRAGALDVRDGATARSSAEAVGYRFRVERRLGEKALLVIEAASRPLLFDSMGARWGSGDGSGSGRDLYLSDREASQREVGLSFEGRPSAGSFIGFGASTGEVRGQVAVSLPEDTLTQDLASGTVRYVVAHLSGRILSTGTALQIELRRLSEEDVLVVEGGEPYSDRRLEVRVLQGLEFLHPGRTTWTLVASYSSLVPRNDGVARRPASYQASSAALNRLSGGVSVKF